MKVFFDSNILVYTPRHKFAFYDAMIVAAALSIGSDVLFSEDMQDGMSVNGSLTIVNPFTSII